MTAPCSGTSATGRTAVTPRADPFTSLAPHFGMLLGVSDLEVLAGHAWSKMRLHNAWLHGDGVVWGYGLEVDGPSREVRVAPGLALDGRGRELLLPTTSCLDLARWFAEHESELTTTTTGDRVAFDAHVVARARACLARPVPALLDTCEGAGADTAYSRVQETVELLLRPGLPPDRPPALVGLPPDTSAIAPQGGLFPADEPAEVLLGVLRGLSLTTAEPVTAGVDAIDLSTRRSHVATADLVELLAGAQPVDSGGPRLDAATAALAGTTVTVTATGPLLGGTLAGATTATVLDSSGAWDDRTGAVTYDDATRTLSVELSSAPAAGEVVRLVVRGTGPQPAMGTGPDGRPLPIAGTTGGPPATATDGADAVVHLEGS